MYQLKNDEARDKHKLIAAQPFVVYENNAAFGDFVKRVGRSYRK